MARSVDDIREKMDEVQIEKDASVFEKMEEICEQIDEDAELLQDEFKETLEGVSSAVDDYIAKLQWYEDNLNIFKHIKIEYEKKIADLEDDQEKYKKDTAKTLKHGARYRGTKGSIRLMKSRPEVRIENEKAIPDEYKVFKTTSTINKVIIRERLMSGSKVDGASLRKSSHITVLKS